MTPRLADTPVIETERLTLRAPVPSDVDMFVSIYGSERSEFIGGHKAPRQAWDFFCTELGHWAVRGFGMFTVTFRGGNTPLGIVGHWCPPNWPEQEIGWVLTESAEGRGIAYEAAQACINHAYEVLGWKTAVSYIATENARSITLAERLGASLDRSAEAPYGDTLVYRHPAPEVLQ